MRKLLLACFIAFAFAASYAADVQDRGGGARAVTQLPSKEKRWALIIGVDNYGNGIQKLYGAVNDSKALKEALVKYANFPDEQVIILTTGRDDEQPTRTNILSRLFMLKQRVPKDGLLLFAFSGHGVERDREVFLLPSDALQTNDVEELKQIAISADTITKQVERAEISQVLILLDACRNDPEAGRGDKDNVLTEAFRKGFSFEVQNKGIVAFATLYATSFGKRAYEFRDRETGRQRGFFNWAVVKGLEGGAANVDGEVTLRDLVDYVAEAVPRKLRAENISGEQRPYPVIGGYKADELVLAVGRARAPSPRPEEGRDAAFYVERGLGHLDLENYDQAISDFGIAVQLDPQNVEAYTNLCAAYKNRGDLNDAIISCNKALRLDPKHAPAYNNLGTAYYDLRKYGPAIENLDEAIRLNPRYAAAHANRCAAHLDRGDPSRAVADCEKAIRLDPDNANAYNNLGVAYYRTRDYTRSIETLKRAISANAHDGDIYASLCGAYVETGALSQAIETCNKAIQLKPNSANAYNNLGSVYHKMRRYDDAITNLGRAVELDPRDENSHTNLGNSYLDAGNYAQAVDSFTQAIRLNRGYARAYRSRAEAQRRAGNKSQAQADLKKAEELERAASKP
jgi:tetratricopeptide (TPR) repeat protein